MARNTEEIGIDPKDARMWAVAGDAYFPCEKVEATLPPGQYTIETSQSRGIYFNKTNVTLDGILKLPDADSEKIVGHIEDFWNRKDRYDAMQVLHKRGILLWGPPGSGKTTTVQQLSANIIDRGGISVYVKDPHISAIGLEILRRIEPERPIVVMIEDIDAMVSGRHDSEAAMLALLDGELQINNVVFVATTNYPERLDKRLVNRPSRFDVVHKIDMPGMAARREFLNKRTPEGINLDKEVYPSAEGEGMRIKLTEDARKLDKKIADVRSDIAVLEAEQDALDPEQDATDISKTATKIKRLESTIVKLEQQQREIDQQLDKVDNNKTLLDYWIEKTDGFSIAHIKELILSVYCFETPFDKAHRRLSKMAETKINSSSSGDDTNW